MKFLLDMNLSPDWVEFLAEKDGSSNSGRWELCPRTLDRPS
jgi:predicted nuclease of predicted toxin-antitoxin system